MAWLSAIFVRILMATWWLVGTGGEGSAMGSKDGNRSPQSVAEENVRVVPLIGYSYPFEQAADAAWVANELKPSVVATHGRVAVIDAELLVVLPDTVQPQQVGNLALFRFEQEE
jgi:hypothetical protein